VSLKVALRKLRKAKGLTQTELAYFVDVSPGAVSQWETGLIKNITGETLFKLVKALDTTPDVLLGFCEAKGDAKAEQLRPDEKNILGVYRALSPKHKEIALRLLKAL
jgi:transcriptional regulator with XRE-family HTH domain